MKNRIASLTLALTVIGVCSSIAIAIPPMGPPKATLQEGQYAIGLEYEHSEMDLQTFGSIKESQFLSGSLLTTETSYTSFEIKDLKSTMIWGRLDAGAWENWDIFVRFGISDAKDEIQSVNADGTLSDKYKDFDGGSGFGWGFGTRFTFYREGDTTWGGLLQVTWSNPDKSDVIIESDPTFSGEAEMDYWEVQIAIGPTIELDNCRLYGGPFLHFINGNLDLNGRIDDPPGAPDLITQETSHEIKEDSQFGGYAGAQWYLDENSSLFTEFQFTDNAWGVGVGTVWKF